MRRLSSSSPRVRLFRGFSAPHIRGSLQHIDQFVRCLEAPRPQLRSDHRFEGFELHGRVGASVNLRRLHAGMPEPERHLPEIFGGLQDGQSTGVAQDVRVKLVLMRALDSASQRYGRACAGCIRNRRGSWHRCEHWGIVLEPETSPRTDSQARTADAVSFHSGKQRSFRPLP